MRLVFVHGWACGPEVWDALAARLAAYEQIRVDLGYFGPPSIAELRPDDVLVGHSAGLLWGLRRRADWAGIIAINGFSRFCVDASGRGCVRPGALRILQRDFVADPQACVELFRATLDVPAPGPAQQEALADGLALLRDFDAAPLLGRAPLLALGALDDPLAPAQASRDLAAHAHGRLEFCDKGGHGLPWTAPDFCAEKITDFLRS